jgi:adenosylcobinamide-phosphate synthase
MRGDAALVLAALAVEACIGYPRALFAAIGHPVAWIGSLIDALDRTWNLARYSDAVRRVLGIASVATIVAVAIAAGYAVERLANLWKYGEVWLVLAATVGLAQRSLYVHVRDVLTALAADDLTAARTYVGRIVGRDTANMQHEQIAAAALESLAESFNDAVVAPTFWLLVGGLPGLFAYKAVNTADSMIGHTEERWRMFGWAAARLDDLANLIPARCAGLLLTLAAQRGLAVMLRDAPKHASPNAGWPEAAMAGGLAIRLGGPANYDGVAYRRPSFGDGKPPQLDDLRRGLLIYKRACALLWLIMVSIAALSWM